MVATSKGGRFIFAVATVGAAVAWKRIASGHPAVTGVNN
jgi:hypothetical protein